MTVGVLLGMNQLEIHGKLWYLFCAGFWVYLGVRTSDVCTSSGVLVFD